LFACLFVLGEVVSSQQGKIQDALNKKKTVMGKRVHKK
jgi:hypothetical protein